MNLSTQLRIILLLVGAAIWLAIYLFGRRKAAQGVAADVPPVDDVPQVREATPGFTPAAELDDDEFETPAYMRRQGQREPRQDYEPRIASAHDYVDMDEVRDDQPFTYDDAERPQIHAAYDVQPSAPLATHRHHASDFKAAEENLQHESAAAESRLEEPGFDEPVYVEPAPIEVAVSEPAATVVSGRREPTITLDEFEVADHPVAAHEPVSVVRDEPVRAIEAEPPTLPGIPVVAHPADAAAQSYAPRVQTMPESASGTAPTLSEAVPTPAERPNTRTSPAVTPAPAAETAKPASTTARRKIIALRIPMPTRVPGTQLLPLLQGERLQHGKFSIFHRLQDAGTVFSVASMVEPGTFDPQAMHEQQFPGVTLFMLLPGPVDGLVAYDQMLSCAQRIAHATGGVLQDERGSKLTPQAMEKLRDEVLDFQHLIGGMAATT